MSMTRLFKTLAFGAAALADQSRLLNVSTNNNTYQFDYNIAALPNLEDRGNIEACLTEIVTNVTTHKYNTTAPSSCNASALFTVKNESYALQTQTEALTPEQCDMLKNMMQFMNDCMKLSNQPHSEDTSTKSAQIGKGISFAITILAVVCVFAIACVAAVRECSRNCPMK